MSEETKQAEFEWTPLDGAMHEIKVLQETTAFQWEQICRIKMLIGVLRAEVKAWRKVNDLHQFIGWMEVNEDHEHAGEVVNAKKATDAANALEER